MRRNFLLLLTGGCFIFFPKGHTQTYFCITNASIEGTPENSDITNASPWVNCVPTPDLCPTGIGAWCNVAANAGSSYAGIGYASGTAESFGQTLCQTLTGGVTYDISVVMRKVNTFPFTDDMYLRIYGSNSSCTTTELLWTSGLVSSTSWTTFSGTFTPSVNYSEVMFSCIEANAGGAAGFINIDAISSSTTLPVELLYINAQVMGDSKIRLMWTTGVEVNNEYFDIERSDDGSLFVPVGRAYGRGNSNTPVDYHYEDEISWPGLIYYRLKQVDYDGKSTYSRIVVVKSLNNVVEIVSVNETEKGSVRILTGSEERQSADIRILDLMGNEIFSNRIFLQKGINENNIESINFSPGIYLVRIEGSFESRTNKFIIR